jgi:hypothetical protein
MKNPSSLTYNPPAVQLGGSYQREYQMTTQHVGES